MKESLKKSIALFSIVEQLKIYYLLFCKKMHIKFPLSYYPLFNQCIEYVKLTEKGVSFLSIDHEFVKATLSVNNKVLDVLIRKNTSDLNVLDSVLLGGEYKIAVDYLQRSLNTQKCIVDAGGNIGLTTLYFYCYFPGSSFIIIEPDARNLLVLKKNLKANNITDTVVLEKALWTSNEALDIDDSFRDGREWSLTVNSSKVSESGKHESQIEGITLCEVSDFYNARNIDLLKMDIEGAERFLFTNQSFLQTVDQTATAMVIEIHDEFNVREMINEKMNCLGFSECVSGDVTLFSRQS